MIAMDAPQCSQNKYVLTEPHFHGCFVLNSSNNANPKREVAIEANSGCPVVQLVLRVNNAGLCD